MKTLGSMIMVPSSLSIACWKYIGFSEVQCFLFCKNPNLGPWDLML